MRKLALVAAGVALLAVPRHPLAAQIFFPTDDPVIQRIWAIGMDSSHTEPLAQALLDSIGPRLTGTPEQKRGNDWLVAMYKSWGIDARNEQWGTWRGWRRGYSHIDLLTPRVRTLEGTMLGYSPGTGKKDLVAEPVILPRFRDSTEFVRWLPSAKGKFVLVSAPQPTCRPSSEWEEFATPESKARMDSLRRAVAQEWGGRNVRGTGYNLALGTGDLGVRMEEAGVAGVITSRPKDAWGTIEVFETYNTKAPAIALSCEDYGLVFRLTENEQHPTIRMNLDAELLGERPVFNTIATIRGSEKPDEYVLLSAHFDSWDGSSGATDNGTGTLTMLEAMRILKQVYPNPKRTIVVGHWTAEEHGLIGSSAFAEDHPEIVQGLQALFNQDNGTGRVVRIGGGGLPDGAQHVAHWLSQLPIEFQQQVTFNGPGYPSSGGSDDASFACYGAPAFGLGALNWDYGSYTWHTNRDTYDKVVFDDLKKNATLTAMLVYLASEDPETVTRERVDLAAMAAARAAQGGNGRFRGLTEWPSCQKAPRSTKARLR
ncbi:MAG TPA: M20/M25/M40 family metallo-hydrolase [Gemmatimonadaceae bacterium]|nr:M20/M25/M40 family metallo-hydrolase [Gemmatimonadaceae bacterium]